ncbi:spartyl-trna synthetase [Diaporthe amygdali]|uniref:spartyl-trna synthetase n=1 Tax=Phomopsis amygdali TaxID=1214568 RepID=UPI0022FF243C|nr:spartyl-trna synthetase [Diaporthe amygdali]KAJ0122906.1 spartyl-trna synthetase [Diaporthe amygdali]
MATKRDIDAVTNVESDEQQSHQPTKRARNLGGQRKSRQATEPQTNVTYGQRCCFPSLDHGYENSDEDLEFEDETDALAYLQTVRQQASGIPHLLVAPKSGPQLPRAPAAAGDLDHDDDSHIANRGIYDDGVGDTRGYYEDGAYTAAPDNPESGGPYDEESLEQTEHDEAAKIAQAYYTSLLTHFTSLRERLHQDPPPEALAALRKEQSPYVGRFGPASRTFTTWSVRVRRSDPAPAQVAAMDKDAVSRLLRVILGGKFLRRGTELRERTSRWLWALLARLPDRGELDYMEVGYVRDLGKRAALLMHSLREMAVLREEVEGGGVGGGGAAQEDDGLEGEQEDWAGEGEVLGDDGAEVAAPQNESIEPAEAVENGQTLAPPSSDLPARSSSTAPTSLPDADGANAKQMEDGEIDESAPMDIDTDVESAKTRLLAKLDAHASSTNDTDPAEEEPPFDPARARMNMRATLNMILTVAGELYGQRDLLEFRDPFQV